MSGTRIRCYACTMRCPVPIYAMLLPGRAADRTERANKGGGALYNGGRARSAGNRDRSEARPSAGRISHIVLRLRYALSGTNLAYAPTRLHSERQSRRWGS
eukprot:3933644-Rhodomonas_salina.1